MWRVPKYLWEGRGWHLRQDKSDLSALAFYNWMLHIYTDALILAVLSDKPSSQESDDRGHLETDSAMLCRVQLVGIWSPTEEKMTGKKCPVHQSHQTFKMSWREEWNRGKSERHQECKLHSEKLFHSFSSHALKKPPREVSQRQGSTCHKGNNLASVRPGRS